MPKTANSLKWSAIERIITQGIQLVVTIFLARILGPEAYGLIGLLTVFIVVSQVIVDSGFSQALIRKQDRTEVDYCTCFYFNILIAFLFYFILFSVAPFIASFYEQPALIDFVRVIGFTLIINSFAIVQRVRLTVKMDFKTLTKISFISVIISSTLAIVAANYNFGVWSLIIQTLAMSLMSVFLLFYYSPWYPKERFSKRSFNNLFGFGSKLLLSSIIDTIYNNVYQIIIAKQFSPISLGYFVQANTLSSVPAMTLTSIVQRVTYPALSKIQHANEQFENYFKLTLQLTASVVFPIMASIAVVAEVIIPILMGEQWAMAGRYLSLLCVSYMLYPIHAINLNILQVKGRADLFLRLEIIKKILITVLLFITVPLGIEAMCLGMIIQSYLSLLINTIYTGKLTSFNLLKQCKLLFPIWLATFVSSMFSLYLMGLFIRPELKILVALTSGLLMYILITYMLSKELFISTYRIIRS
ncbi:MAG: teichuronic acid exporter [Polaribacter sp.]|jgi:teichuronic acid exporter